MNKRQLRSQDVGVLKWLGDCFDIWIARGFILWSPGHKILSRGAKERSIVWTTYDPKIYKPTELVWSSVSEYLDILRSGQFSALLFDGSIIQMTVDYAGADVVGHRYAYFPCPVRISSKSFDDVSASGMPLDEFLSEAVQASTMEELRSWPTMRFDFAAKEITGEPFSHIHLGPEDCRVPLLGPLSLFRFLSFISRTFYSNEAPVTPMISLGTHPKSTMRQGEREPIHLAW